MTEEMMDTMAVAQPATPHVNSSRPVSIDAHAHWAQEPYVRLILQMGRTPSMGPLNPMMSDLERAREVDGHARREDARPHAVGLRLR
jgi:hypothetical protein